jgi:pSer/pThr/pTyr-binding forkhead associated (FHA) protein
MAPASTLAAAAPVAAGGATLVLIRPDGSEGESYKLAAGSSTVGRDSGAPFAVDSYLSPKHASFEVKGSDVTIKDLGSLNGVYLRVDKDVPYELGSGDMFRIGQEILRFEAFGAPSLDAGGVEIMGSPNADIIGRLTLVVGRETTANAFPIPSTGIHLGRERGDVIFPEDGYVSGLHCNLQLKNGKVFLTDVGSSNGTFLRIRDEKKIKFGSLLLLGQQLFRIQN